MATGINRVGFRTKAVIAQEEKDAANQLKDDARGFDIEFKEETAKRMIQLVGTIQSSEFEMFPPEHQQMMKEDLEYYKRIKASFLV